MIPERNPGAPEDPDLVHALGLELARTLLHAIRARRAVGSTSDQVSQIEEAAAGLFAGAVNHAYSELGPLLLRVHASQDAPSLSLQGVPVPDLKLDARAASPLAAELVAIGIGTLQFTTPIGEGTSRALVSILAASPSGEPAALLQRLLPFAPDIKVEAEAAPEFERSGAPLQATRREEKTPAPRRLLPVGPRFRELSLPGTERAVPEVPPSIDPKAAERAANALSAAARVCLLHEAAARDGQRIGLRHTRRAALRLLSSLLEDRAALLEVAPRRASSSSEDHAASCAALTIALGERLGLGREPLLQIGAVALIAREGAMEIFRQGGLTPLTARLMEDALEAPAGSTEAPLGARLRQVAAAFLSLLAPGARSEGEVSPELAASWLANRGRGSLDRGAVQILLEILKRA